MIQQYCLGDASQVKCWEIPQSKQTALLPLTAVSLGDFTCDSTYYTKRKGYPICMLFYTISGTGRIKHMNREYMLKPDQLVILDGRQYHYQSTLGEQWRYLLINVSGSCAFTYTAMFNGSDGHPLSLQNRISIPAVFDRIRSISDHFDLRGEREITRLLTDLLTNLIAMKETDTFSRRYSRHQATLEESIRYLQSHFQDPISVEDLASRCHVSTNHYLNIFKAYTGQTPYSYLLRYRIQQAKQLLLQSTASVEDIARQTGFSDSKNFICCFKKTVGTTPLQFRKQDVFPSDTLFSVTTPTFP